MRKIYGLIVGLMVLCFTSCGTGRGAEVSDEKNREMENAADTEGTFELTEQGTRFLLELCKTLSDFDSSTVMDEAFWRDFLFYSYTGLSERFDTEMIYREDLGFDEMTVKVSLQEAEAYAELVFGFELPDIKPSFDEMEERQTSFFYQDGYYYIGVSDFPAYDYRFAGYEEADDRINVQFVADFEGKPDVGMIRFTILPEDNENGFVVTSKTTEFF